MVKTPLVLTNGEVEQLQAGDTLAGSSGTTIKQIEVDFGTTPVSEGLFTITDVAVTNISNIIASMAYKAATNKDLDECEMDNLIIRCSNGVGTFDMYIITDDGSYLADKFFINYLIG